MADPVPGVGLVRGMRRLGRGLASFALLPFFLLGRFWPGRAAALDDPAREADGLTLLFTGIQGKSHLELQMALGLADAGTPGRIEVVDWTTGNPLLALYHLRATHLAVEAAARAVERVAAQRRTHPDAPIHLVGYSGGAYVLLLVLETLPAGVRVTSAALVAPAVSPFLDVAPLAAHAERGLFSFWSPWDVPILGGVTTLFGTCDGWHAPSAGMLGFHPEGLVVPGETPRGGTPDVTGRFRELRYRCGWLRRFHYGGPLGYANRVWSGEVLGRLLLGRSPPE